jgi:hypothetical protein
MRVILSLPARQNSFQASWIEAVSSRCQAGIQGIEAIKRGLLEPKLSRASRNENPPGRRRSAVCKRISSILIAVAGRLRCAGFCPRVLGPVPSPGAKIK